VTSEEFKDELERLMAVYKDYQIAPADAVIKLLQQRVVQLQEALDNAEYIFDELHFTLTTEQAQDLLQSITRYDSPWEGKSETHAEVKRRLQEVLYDHGGPS
jgi:flagellin-specific chaperone FliS